jgi:hypothetical protein
MIWLGFVVEVPHASDGWREATVFSPTDRFLLRVHHRQHMISIALDDEAVIGLPSGLPFGRASTNTLAIAFPLDATREKLSSSDKVPFGTDPAVSSEERAVSRHHPLFRSPRTSGAS